MEIARERRWTAALLGVCLLAAVFVFHKVFLHHGLDWYVGFTAILTGCGTFALFLFRQREAIIRLLRSPRSPSPTELAAARDRLHAALAASLSEVVPEIYASLPMRVGFAPWRDPDEAEAGQPHDPKSGAGTFATVGDDFRRAPRFRRVVLGVEGAGKSALVAELQRALIESPLDGDPLPVLVHARAWQPGEKSLLDWLGIQIAADQHERSSVLARALVARGMVLPIIEGLEEMPDDDTLDLAISRINEHHVYRPLVLIFRTEKYAQAIRRHGTGIKDCPVVELRPLPLPDVRAYLAQSGRSGWEGALTGLNDDSPLAQVLSNPLMLYLARTEYEEQAADSLVFFGNEAALKAHLLKEFMPAAYDQRRWDMVQHQVAPERATQWLWNLAWDRKGAPVAWAWWRLEVPGRWRGLGAGIRTALRCTAVAALTIWVLARQGYWRHGAYAGPVNYGHLFLGGPVGRQVRPTMTTLGAAVRELVGHGTVYVSRGADWILAHPVIDVLILVGLAVTGASELNAYGPQRVRVGGYTALRAAMRACRLIFIVALIAAAALLRGAPGPVSESAFFSSRSTWTTLAAFSLLGLLAVPWSLLVLSDTEGSLGPDDSLHLDRQADVTVTVARRGLAVVAAYLFCGSLIALAYAIYAAIATAVGLLLGGSLSFASRSFTVARLRLVVEGRAPWRIMAFLGEASWRGVLRPAGALYVFRHAPLADEFPTWKTGTTRWAEWREIPRKRAATTRNQKLLIQSKDALATARGASAGDLLDLADDLDVLVSWLSRGENLAVGQAAENVVTAYGLLAAADPAAFRPRRAAALRQLAAAGRWDERVRMAKAAVAEFRELAAADPAAYLPDLARAMNSLARALFSLGQRDQLAPDAATLVTDLRAATETVDQATRPALAEALVTSLWVLAEVSRDTAPDDGVGHLRAAAEILGDLSVGDRARFLPMRTTVLDQLAKDLHGLGRKDEELAAVRQSYQCYLGSGCLTGPLR